MKRWKKQTALALMLFGTTMILACGSRRTLYSLTTESSVTEEVTEEEQVTFEETKVAPSEEELLVVVGDSDHGELEKFENSAIESEKFEFGAEETLEDLKEEASEEVDFSYEDVIEYAYTQLDEQEKKWYLDVKNIMSKMKKKGKLKADGLSSGLDDKDLDKIFYCVMMDHPEIFYVDGYRYTKLLRGEKITSMEFEPSYTMDKEEALERKSKIEAEAEKILSNVSKSASDYDKVKYIYERIIKKTEYDLNASDNQNIYSVLVGRASVCQGYAKTFQYLTQRLGLECTLVQGSVIGGGGHAWDLVKMDGAYYYVDTTWGDASYRLVSEDGQEGHVPDITYDYLGVTTNELLRTHKIDKKVPLPKCTDTKCNYYVKEGAYFTFYDKDRMRNLFQNYLNQGIGDITIKCSDEASYDEVFHGVIEEKDIIEFLINQNSRVSYAENREQWSLTFWVTNG